MAFIEDANAIAKQYADKYASDIDKAKELGFAAVRKHPQFEEFFEEMAYGWFIELIENARSNYNAALRKALNHPGPPKVKPMAENAGIVAQCVLNFRISGKTVGDLRFSELPDLIQKQRAEANAHTIEARFLAALYKQKPAKGDPVVRDKVKGDVADKLYENAKHNIKGPLPARMQPAATAKQ